MVESGQRCQVVGGGEIEEERYQFPGLMIKERLAFIYTDEKELEILAISPTNETDEFEEFGGAACSHVICKIHNQNLEDVFKDIESLTFLEFAKKYVFLHCRLSQRKAAI
jgi:hypothetical protein